MSKKEQLIREAAGRLREIRPVVVGPDIDTAAKLAGVKKSTYYQYENGNRIPGIETAVDMAKRTGISLDAWLLGRGRDDDHAPDGMTVVPLLSWISAGAMAKDDVRDEALGSIRVADLPDGDWIALEVKGDSMDRISPPASRIIVNRRDKGLVPNACYVIDDGEGNATYKRYRPGPMRFEPVSTNPAHEPIFPDNEPTVVGRVYESILRL